MKAEVRYFSLDDYEDEKEQYKPKDIIHMKEKANVEKTNNEGNIILS